MFTTCVVCNIFNTGMIGIFQHPNNLDVMLTFLSGHQTDRDDYLCISCYDELKIAFNFKQKCLQSKFFRAQNSTETVASTTPIIPADTDEQENILTDAEQLEISSSSGVVTEQIHRTIKKEYKISSNSITSYNEEEIQECIEDYLINEKSNDNQELEESLEDEGNAIDTLDSDGSLGIKEQLDKNQEVDDDNDDVEVEEDLEEDETEEEVENDKQNTINLEISYKNLSTNERRKKHSHQKRSTSTEKRERIPRDKHRRGPVPKYHENDIFKNLKETQCEFCYAIFPTVQELRDHEDSHKREDRPYRCNHSDCLAQFKDRYSVRSHISIHTGEKRYKCRYCEKKFHQSGNLKSHERYHTGEKPYLCPHCGKGFAENGNLKSHIRHHTGERPYECPYCAKTFRTHYSHKVHIRSHTQEKPFECGDCGKTFNCTGKLKIHQRIHTGVRPFKCKLCSAAFMDSSRLKRHLKTHNNLIFSNGKDIQTE